MPYKVSYLLTEKYDPTQKLIGIRVAISGFSKFKNQKIRFSAFPSQEVTFTSTGALTFTALGTPGNNVLEVIDKKTSKVLQQISSINGNILTGGLKGQELIISHDSTSASIEIKGVADLKEEYIRLDSAPKIPIFFGLDIDNKQPIYTKKVDKKGYLKEHITGSITEKHEVRVLTSQMNKIISIKPPE